MPPRKKWRTVYPGIAAADEFRSESSAYDNVGLRRAAWAEGAPTGSLTVQVDEGLGAGWQDYEHIRFAEEGQP